jgi:hypothetical protein
MFDQHAATFSRVSSAPDQRRHAVPLALAGPGLAVLLGGAMVADLLTPVGLAVWLVYVLALLLDAMLSARPRTWVVATAASVLVVAGFLYSPPGVDPRLALANRSSCLVVLWGMAWLLVRLQRADQRRKAVLADLQDALDNVRTLKGLLPICASCKKIRDDEGYWVQIEAYVRDRTEADFSHGICPECMRKLYPEFAQSVEGAAALAKASAAIDRGASFRGAM